MSGLLASQRTRSGIPNNSTYYILKGQPIESPTLIAPIFLQGNADEGGLTIPASIQVPGLTHPDADYVGAIGLRPGGNLDAPQGSNGIVIRATNGIAPATTATIVEIGTDAEGPNKLFIAGASGVSEVYTSLYNPVIKATAVAAASGALPDTTGFTFTPLVSGAYMLQVNINIRNFDNIPVDGFIEWVLNADGGEVQFVSNTLKSLSIAKAVEMNDINGVPGIIDEPVDYSFSDLCFLTEDVPVSFNIFTARNSFAGGPQWAIQNYQARLIQMC